MGNPVLVNRAPVPGTIGNVSDGIRMSVRLDSAPIDRSLLNVYLGYGKTRWEGGILPEDNETGIFVLDRLYGNVAPAPDSYALITVGIDDWLKIDKYLMGDEQHAWYSFGRLEAPAAGDAALMAEFSLRLTHTDTAPDADDFTGVIFGLFAGTSGCMVKFFNDGAGTRWIEMHSADLSITAAPGPEFIANYDWTGIENTFKLLWDPIRDVVKLYRSVGQSSNLTDEVLISGQVSTLEPVPSDQIRANLPIAFFGHGFHDSTSISYWKTALLYHEVTKGIIDGIFQGEHEGSEKSDNVSYYLPEKSRDRRSPAWLPIPDSFDTIVGTALITEQVLVMTKRDRAASFGYYRTEPAILAGPLILDIWMVGQVFYQGTGIQTTGMEVYVSDGTKSARMALLYNYTTRQVGILSTMNPPSYMNAYIGSDIDWTSQRHYRLVFVPNGQTMLFEVTSEDGGLLYNQLGSIDYLILPTDTMPGPGVGILHNGTIGDTEAEMRVWGIRYLPNAHLWFGSVLPPSPTWTLNGTGTATSASGVMTLEDAIYFSHTEGSTLLQSRIGYTVEFQMKVDSYDTDSPLRSNAGLGITIDDGSGRLELRFADAGPELGKVIYIADDDDFDDVLLRIRSGDESIVGHYAIVDWTLAKVYRIERTIGENVRVFVDEASDPVIDLDAYSFEYLPTHGSAAIVFGHLEATTAISQWSFLHFSLSLGIDVQIDQVRDAGTRFDSVVNVIASFE